MSFELALQQSIFTRLSAYASLTAVANVFDHVPQNTSYPFVALGESILAAWSGDDFVGASATFAVHVWSQYDGQKECKQIMGHIFDALSRYEIALDGYTLVMCEWISSSSFLEPDGLTRHGVVEFQIIYA